NRYSVSMGFSAGLFAALMPLPFQMLLAAALSIILRGNLPIAVALTWVTNPVTTPPIAYFCYLVGTFVLQTPPQHFKLELSWEWLMREIGGIGLPFVVGSVIVAVIAAILSNIIIRLIWRWAIIKAWRERHTARSLARRKKKSTRKKKHTKPSVS
ncbi:MAG TPA: DUF2062 domain-containing protein, partial [Candidatus Berkiella sp.]|nr:DUF2062 domain-containing protein [Candidatus Berkiella sp.]